MNNQASIGKFEFFSIIFLYTMYFVMGKCLGIEVLQDAWIATVFSGAFGIVLVIFYVFLYQKHIGKDLLQGIIFFLGKKAGKVIVLCYGVYFLFNSVLALLSTELVLKNSILNNTKSWQIVLPLILLCMYLIYLGMQSISRTSVIFVYITVFGFILLVVLLYASKAFKPFLLTPIFEYGFKPVLKASLGSAFMPFANLIVMMLLFPFVKARKSLLRTTVVTTAITALTISSIILIMIITIHPIIVSISKFPFLETSFRIDLIQNFIHRIDPIIVMLVVSFALLNLIINFWGAFRALTYTFTKIPTGVAIIIMGFLVFVTTLMISNQVVRNANLFQSIDYSVSIFFGVFLPILLYIIYSIIDRRNKKRRKI